jgi:autotransporter-associated beta strand protein
MGGNVVGTHTGTTANLTLNIASGTNTFGSSGVIGGLGNGENNIALIKSGAGTLELTGANTYTAGTTLSAGILQLGVNSVGMVGSITSSSIGTGRLTFNGGSISSATSTSLSILNAVNFTGNAGFGGGGSGNLAFSANIDLGGVTRMLTTVADTTFNGIVSNGGINKEGANTLTLSGSNSYTGNTTVSAGGLQLATNGSLRFVIGGSGTNNAINGTGTTTINGQFVFDLTGASTITNSTWTIVAASLNPTYGTSFNVAGFIGNGLGNWTKETNGVRYIFSQSSSVLSVQPIGGVTPYNAWVSSWPGFIQTAGTDDPDGDGYNNNMEFAFDGDPTVGSPALISVASSAAGPVFSFLARRDTGAVSYVVESTSDLSTVPWTDNNVVTASIKESSNQANVPLAGSYVRLEFTVTSAGGKSFYRVRATIAP